eukprot:1490953-Prymnesium_polylepis.1
MHRHWCVSPGRLADGLDAWLILVRIGARRGRWQEIEMGAFVAAVRCPARDRRGEDPNSYRA